MASRKRERSNVEDVPRVSFTPGWSKSIAEVDALPVKQNGKVVRVTRIAADQPREESDGSDTEDNAEVIVKNKNAGVDGSTSGLGEKASKKAKKEKKPEKPMVVVQRTPAQSQRLQQKIADICNAIVSAPEASLRKRALQLGDSTTGKDSDADDAENGDNQYKMVDLFELLRSNDAQEFELAMLSALIVFKDICPGYRIRSAEEYDKEVQLKKETKSLKDFELSLLGAYQKYIKILEDKVSKGLGSAKREINTWGVEEKLGLSALRCLCELLRTLSHFNFRTQILATVAMRATQPDDNVSTLCCDTLRNLLINDQQAELSYEIVRDIGKVLALCKYTAAERVVQCLLHVKMTVHADDARDVHRKAKSERKKRKKNQDEVDLGLLESSATADISNKKRFQADCLHEICLIYFRIVKGKVGFSLLPAALEGLSRITHLMNIDTVQDLMVCLKGILEQTSPAPLSVQLQCVHCALRTLSGPGAELNLDSDVYLHKLRNLIRDLPADCEDWEAILECLDICFLKKREERANIVLSFVRLLLMSAVHESNTRGAVIYAMAHAILLRYPRVRQDMLAVRLAATAAVGAKGATTSSTAVLDTSAGKKKAPVLFTEDEVVEDLAMKRLREEAAGDSSSLDNVHWDFQEDKLGDGSWLLPLQRKHVDPRYGGIVNALSHKDLLPMPLRVADVKIPAVETITQRLLFALQSLPATKDGKVKAKAPAQGGGNGLASTPGQKGGKFQKFAKGGKVGHRQQFKGRK